MSSRGHTIKKTGRTSEGGVVRSNTTEARFIDRTTFHHVSHGNKITRTRQGTKQELEPYCGCGALQRSSPFLQTSASSVSDRTRKTVTIDVARRAPCRRASDACTAAFSPARPAALNLFFLLFDGFELFLTSNLHCAFQPLLMMRIGIITCGVVPDELVPQYGT